MVEIKAGAELDKVVAEAIGYDATIYYSHDLERNVCLLLPSEKSFSPSADLNAAFDAAEQAGLFTSNRALKANRHRWELVEIGDPLDRTVSSGDTPSLAICAAILYLSKRGG